MSKTTLHLAYVAAGLTCTGIAESLRQVTGVSDAAAAERVKAVVTPLLNMAFSDGRKFITDTVSSTKATKEAKPDRVVEVRASELRQIYGALKMVEGFSIEGLAWEASYLKAKETLKAKGIRASGDKVLTEEQKALKAIATEQPTILAELMAAPENAERKASEIAAQAQKIAAERVSESDVKKHAARIIKANGVPYAIRLYHALAIAIAEAETEQTQETTVEQTAEAMPKTVAVKSKR